MTRPRAAHILIAAAQDWHEDVEGLTDAAFRVAVASWRLADIDGRLPDTFRPNTRIRRQLIAANLLTVVEGRLHVVARPDIWRGPFIPSTNARPAIPAELRAAVYERDGYRCLECGTTEDLSLDHVWPYSRGGLDTYENLATLCRPCNSRKGARVT